MVCCLLHGYGASLSDDVTGQGHTRPLSALAFSGSGDRIVSYSAEEASVRCWQIGSTGFFGGMLGVQGRCVKQIDLAPVSDGTTPSKLTDVDILQNCRLQWVECNRSTVNLVREDCSKCTLGLS